MKKKLALVLASIAVVATIFTGCGEKDISGDYTAEMNVSEFMNESDLEAVDEMGIDLRSLTVDVDMNLSAKKDFTISFNTASFREQYTTLINDNLDTIIDNALIAQGVSRDDITDELAQLSGYDSADALFDDLKQEISTELDTALDGLDEELAEYTVTGSYRTDNDNVIFTTSDEEDDSLLVDNGVLNDDGSITINSELDDGSSFSMDFKPNK